MKIDAPILILGSGGLVGSSVERALCRLGYKDLLVPRRKELDLLHQAAVFEYFEKHRPACVILAAAKVGGIHANNEFRADFIYENLTIQSNVFGAAFKYPVKKFLFLGSSCIYPKYSPQPIKEDYLLTGPLEETNEPYAIAKIAGQKTAESFRRQYNKPYFTIMPSNLYGPNDNFHPTNSHVIPGLIVRMSAAQRNREKTFKVWGSGNILREFLHVDDLAQACLYFLSHPGPLPDLINIGAGKDIKIRELAEMIKALVGFDGELIFDTSRPDGPPQKLLDISLAKSLGWSPQISLKEGLADVWKYYVEVIQPKELGQH